MKTIITSLALAALIICFLPSCKKTETASSTTTQTPLQKILGKWGLQSIIDNDHYAGADHITTTTGTPADYFEFKTDGKIYYSISGFTDVVTYSLKNNDTQILIDGTETYDIKTLNASSFIMNQKTLRSGSDYDEETITLKK